MTHRTMSERSYHGATSRYQKHRVLESEVLSHTAKHDRSCLTARLCYQSVNENKNEHFLVKPI